jgi:hypothetical protein
MEARKRAASEKFHQAFVTTLCLGRVAAGDQTVKVVSSFKQILRSMLHNTHALLRIKETSLFLTNYLLIKLYLLL